MLLLFILFGVFFWFVFSLKKHVFSFYFFFIVYYYHFFYCFCSFVFSYFQLFFEKIKFSFFRNSFSFFSMFSFNVFEFALECLDWLFFLGGLLFFWISIICFYWVFEIFSESLSFFLVIIATFRSSPVRSSLYGLHWGLKLETSRESLNRT